MQYVIFEVVEADSRAQAIEKLTKGEFKSFLSKDFLKVEVQRLYCFDTERPLKAFVDVVINNALLIKGMKVMRSGRGHSDDLFVSMPQEQGKDMKWYNTIRILTTEFKDHIADVVLEAYRAHIYEAQLIEDENNDEYPENEDYEEEEDM